MDEDFTERGAFAAPDDEDVFGVAVTQHGRLDEHLVVEGFVVQGALDGAVEEQGAAVVEGVGDEHVLESGGAGVDHLGQFECICVEWVALFDEDGSVLGQRWVG